VATLPPKPDSIKRYAHQQRIALGYRLNPAGIDKADRDARILGGKMIAGEFDWSDYIEVKGQIHTVGDAVAAFCAHYRNKRLTRGDDPRKVEQTLETNYLKYLDRLDHDAPVNVEVLSDRLLAMPHTATRRLTALAYASMVDAVGLPNKLRSLAGGYGPSYVNPRNVPTDKEIVKVFDSIKSKRWRSAYALMAVYGLRDYEVFRCDLSELPVLFVNKGKTKEERHVYPLYPEWIDWISPDMVMPKLNLDRSNLSLGGDVSVFFYRNNIPFTAYNLRHAWARRSMEFGWDLTLAAKQMGHSVKVHSDIYHAWISQDVYSKAYQQILDNPDRPKPPL
jgi:integrase